MVAGAMSLSTDMGKKTRRTRQKQIIEHEIGRMSKLFTAEELFSRIKGTEKGIGIATVYRALREMSTTGKLHPYICGKKKIFSYSSECHCHFICHRCGRVEHMIPKRIDFIKEMLTKDICHFQIDAYGLCESCREKLGK